jgi:hypothetical protein
MFIKLDFLFKKIYNNILFIKRQENMRDKINKKHSRHHTENSGKSPETIQQENEQARDAAMTPPTPDQFVRPGNIPPSIDHWGTQQPTPVLGNGTL